MNEKFSKRVKDVLIYSKEEAERLGNSYVAPEHLLLGIFRDGEGPAIDLLLALNADIRKIKNSIEERVRTNAPFNFNQDLPLSKSSEDIFKYVILEARALKTSEIDTDHLLLAILRQDSNIAAEELKRDGIAYTNVLSLIKKKGDRSSGSNLNMDINPTDGYEEDEDDVIVEPSGQKSANSNAKKQSVQDEKTPALNTFGVDMTKAAREGALDPVVGREKEIERLVQILSRRKKNNPVLIGEPGVGKSAIVEGLALRIVQKRVPYTMFGKRVVSLDLAAVVAGTKYRGQFEERIIAILNEISKNKNIILFIDEMHTIVGAGSSSGSLDAANMLKPALARGEVQCIGATTLDEYRKNIENDGALERRFQKIIVEPTSKEDTLTILENLQERYEEHHNVSYTDEALKACVDYTEKYVSDRHFPDKAIDALDEAGARMKNLNSADIPAHITNLENALKAVGEEKGNAIKSGNFNLASGFREKEILIEKELKTETMKWHDSLRNEPQVVTEDNVREVISLMTGVPIQKMTQDENTKLLNMEPTIKQSIIGQDDAITKIVKAIRRNRIGLKDPNRPIGTFIFLGPTGVGKTHLAKVLTKEMFESHDALIRIDMSEYMEKFSVSRLIGAPPGYVGYEEGGQLTERVRRKPYSIVLLDEIEKAHPDVFNLLLQVLDEGRLTDSLGRQIDFKNTVIIMTSNVGTRQLKEFGGGIGYTRSDKKDDKEFAHGVITKALSKTFSPEFLNRVDDIIVFDQLSKESIKQIIDIELKGVYKRIKDLGYTLTLTDDAKSFIAEKGYDVQFGARPLKRAIQKYVEDEIAEVLLTGEINEDDEIVIELNDGKICCSVKKHITAAPLLEEEMALLDN